MTLLAVLLMSFGMTASADSYCGNPGCCQASNCRSGCRQPCYNAYPCDPCDIPAPICGTDCGLSVCSIAAAIAAVVAVAAIILSSPGASTVHSHNP